MSSIGVSVRSVRGTKRAWRRPCIIIFSSLIHRFRRRRTDCGRGDQQVLGAGRGSAGTKTIGVPSLEASSPSTSQAFSSTAGLFDRAGEILVCSAAGTRRPRWFEKESRCGLWTADAGSWTVGELLTPGQQHCRRRRVMHCWSGPKLCQSNRRSR